MVKLTTSVALLMLLLFSGCSTTKVVSTPISASPASGSSAPGPVTGPPSVEGSNPRKLWHRRFNGYITDLNVSRDGKAVLISSAPNRDVEGGARQYEVARLDSAGKTVWHFQPNAPVKAQAVSDDGNLFVISTYDDRMTAYDVSGKELWSADGTCKPLILTPLKKVLCYHDDDAEAEVAFDVFSWKGEKLLSYPISNDVLQLKVADDHRYFAVALTLGQVLLFNPEMRSLWQKHVAGEILDVAVSSGAGGTAPRVAVLWSTGKNKRKLTLFDSKGKNRAEIRLAETVTQVEFSTDAERIVLYGNTSKGQVLLVLDADQGLLVERARHLEAWNPDANLPMVVTSDLALISLGGRFIEAVELLSGAERWRLPVSREESVYLYSQSYAAGASTLLAGTDDGSITAYSLKGGK